MAPKERLSKKERDELMNDFRGDDPVKATLAGLALERNREAIKEWIASENAESAKERVEQGDGFAILWAVDQCLSGGIVSPDWLAKAFREKFEAVRGAKVRSWDDAFGKPPTKNQQLSGPNSLSKRNRIMWEIFSLVESLAGKPKIQTGHEKYALDIAPNRETFKIGDELFEFVAENLAWLLGKGSEKQRAMCGARGDTKAKELADLGISLERKTTSVAELYYEAKKINDSHNRMVEARLKKNNKEFSDNQK